ncbi:MAG: hypothetical protein IPK33_17210 [Gemmatimonadetes bacterium]|nr:hypothetical protein [Gemmatimonadota bacterium]
MWSDNETAVDLLNVQHIVKAVLSVVRDTRLSPITAGVYGDWGSGKSSVLKMVKAELDADPKTVCVYFNGWRFEGYEDAKVALAATILETLQKEMQGERGKLREIVDGAKSRLERLLDRVDLLRATKVLVGAGVNAALSAGGVALAMHGAGGDITASALGLAGWMSLIQQTKKIEGKDVADLIKKKEEAEKQQHRETRQAVREFRDDFEKLVRELPLKRLVVVVDDLDRCLPGIVIDTFEAIRLFLSVENTAFVIAADESLMRYAVAQRYPEYEEVAPDGSGRRKIDVGGRYLEKFVQVPVRIPPLSPGDMHGYLNLLFAERNTEEKDLAGFPALCTKVREATAYDQIAFRADEAEAILGAPPSEELKADLALAEQLAPVLAASAEGNPRQTKRFLNALLLRMDMAEARNVKLDRPIAAKLLLLEYFQPTFFSSLAQSAVVQGGVAAELAILEAQVRPAQAAVPAEDDGASDKVPREAAKRAMPRASEPPMLPAYTVGLIDSPKARAWLAADPQIGSTDLRAYIYFAAERFLVQTGGDQRLSAVGQDVLRDLSSESESFHVRGAGRLATLQGTEVNVIIATLAQSARRSTDLGDKTSPLYALFRVADARTEAAGDVLRAVVNIPAEILPSSAPVRVGDIGRAVSARPTAIQVLERWEHQTVNARLKRSAASRLADLRESKPEIVA